MIIFKGQESIYFCLETPPLGAYFVMFTTGLTHFLLLSPIVKEFLDLVEKHSGIVT